MLFFGYSRDVLDGLRCEIVKLVWDKVELGLWGEYYGGEISLCVDDEGGLVDDDGVEREQNGVDE